VKTASVSKLKASLNAYLKRVKAGEEVLVTERGRPVAKLSRVPSSRKLVEHPAKIHRKDLLKLASGALPKHFWKLPRPKDPKGLTVKAVLEERERGW
jgi:prevent-host-death family protein